VLEPAAGAAAPAGDRSDVRDRARCSGDATAHCPTARLEVFIPFPEPAPEQNHIGGEACEPEGGMPCPSPFH
jgi:hypothetical protein